MTICHKLNRMVIKMKSNFYLEDDNLIVAKNPDGMLLMPIEQAQKMGLVAYQKYQSFGFDKLNQNYLKHLLNHNPKGYFIQTEMNKKVSQPLNICFNLNQAGFHQYAQNLIIVEANSQLNLKVSCQADTCANNANHYSLTQIVVKKGGIINMEMEHTWQSTNQVFPLTVIELADQATLNYNYKCYKSPLKIISNPTICLSGQSSLCQIKSAIKSLPKSYNDLGVNIFLGGDNSRATYQSKVVALGGKNINNSKICATNDNAFGHLECDGLVLDKNGDIVTSPILQTINCQADLSHEASISKIKPANLAYLASRGLDEQQAIELIVKGFFD